MKSKVGRSYVWVAVTVCSAEVEEAEPPAVLVASESPAEPPAVESPTEPEAEPEVEEVPAPASDEEVKPKEVPKRVKVWSLAPNKGVDLAIESGVASAEPQTVGQMFQDTLRNWPTRQALMSKENGVWNPVTYEQYYANCLGAAKSFKKVGEKTGHVGSGTYFGKQVRLCKLLGTWVG